MVTPIYIFLKVSIRFLLNLNEVYLGWTKVNIGSFCFFFFLLLAVAMTYGSFRARDKTLLDPQSLDHQGLSWLLYQVRRTYRVTSFL